MNLLQAIIDYYHGEARHGFWAAVIGGLLLAGSIAIWIWASPLSLLKGFAIPMFLFGLLMGIGGGADNIYTKKTTPEKIALYRKDPTAFLKQEKVKTEKTHRGWHGIRIFWGILGLSGVVLSLLIRKPFWIGAGLGTIALAIFLSLFEYYSMQFNEKYYHTIQAVPEQVAKADVQKLHTNALLQEKTQQPAIEPQVSEQEPPSPKTGNLPPDIIQRDSLTTLAAPPIIPVIVKDSVSFNNPNDLKLPVPTNEVAQVSLQEKGKKKKVIDYYNSDLIQANGVNAKHCWFNKKYIKE